MVNQFRENKQDKSIRHFDEYETNRYGIKFITVLYLVVVLVWVLNTIHIFIIDANLMNRTLEGTTVILLGGYIGSIFIGFKRPIAKYYYIFILYAIITYASVYMTYHTTLTAVFPLIYAVQYRKRSITVYAYILAVIDIILSIILGFYYGLCDANMLLLTNTTTTNQINLFLASGLNFNEDVAILILYYGVPRALLVAAVIPLLNHISASITAKTQRELENKRLAETDDLSGLFNKNTFLRKAGNAYSNLGDAAGALVFVDMDHFKNINDTLGHNLGDEAIKDAAGTIREVFRQGDILGRFGGDEFVIFLRSIPENILKERLEDLRSNMKKTYTENGKSVTTTASIGAVFFKAQPDISFGQIMKMADEQTYLAKDAGRNRVSIRVI